MLTYGCATARRGSSTSTKTPPACHRARPQFCTHRADTLIPTRHRARLQLPLPLEPLRPSLLAAVPPLRQIVASCVLAANHEAENHPIVVHHASLEGRPTTRRLPSAICRCDLPAEPTGRLSLCSLSCSLHPPPCLLVNHGCCAPPIASLKPAYSRRPARSRPCAQHNNSPSRAHLNVDMPLTYSLE